MRRYLGLALISIVLVLGSGCEELRVFLEDVYGIPPISEADKNDETIKKALEADKTMKEIDKADELLEQGVKTRNIEPIKQAAKLRPGDAKYEFYLAAAYVTQKDVDKYTDSIGKALQIVRANYPNMSKGEQIGLWLRLGVEATYKLLSGYESATARGWLEGPYCKFLAYYERGLREFRGVGNSGYPRNYCEEL